MVLRTSLQHIKSVARSWKKCLSTVIWDIPAYCRWTTSWQPEYYTKTSARRRTPLSRYWWLHAGNYRFPINSNRDHQLAAAISAECNQALSKSPFYWKLWGSVFNFNFSTVKSNCAWAQIKFPN